MRPYIKICIIMEECKTNIESKQCEKALSVMSPFEIKNELIELAQDEAKKSTAIFLNAGRGNPNWVTTEPRQAFFLLGKWALDESARVWSVP